MRAASLLPGMGPLMWMLPLYLHVNNKKNPVMMMMMMMMIYYNVFSYFETSKRTVLLLGQTR